MNERNSPAWLTDVKETWPVTSTETIAKTKIVTLRQDQVLMPDGHNATRDVVQHPGAVAILALDESGQVLLIRQYRHPAARLLWEIPAGLRDVAGEPLVQTARRELLEEAGYQAAHWQVLADVFTSPGISTERLRVFLATGLTQVPDDERSYVRQDEEAQLVVKWAPLEAVIEAVLAGELHNGVTAIGVLAAYAARPAGFARLREANAPER